MSIDFWDMDPAETSAPASEMLIMMVSPGLQEELRKLAEEDGISVGEVLVHAVVAYKEKKNRGER